MNYFITAIGTDSGKTLVSAIFCNALKADYWKPIQAGLPGDSSLVKSLCIYDFKVHKEAYLLNTPESPHASAKKDGVAIRLEDIQIPTTKNNLIIEGAGGLMVPLNENDLMIDLINKLKVEVILVCDLYLGSINHSLLSIEALHSRKIPIKGIVFNGTSNKESEDIILAKAQVPCILRVSKEKLIDQEVVQKYASQLKKTLLV